MNKKAILATVVCAWSRKDDCIIAESPMLDSLIGVGDTVQEAFKAYGDMLDDVYVSYLEGRMSTGKVGRPTRGKVALNIDVNPDTKNFLMAIHKDLGISIGDVVDYLVMKYSRGVGIEQCHNKVRSEVI